MRKMLQVLLGAVLLHLAATSVLAEDLKLDFIWPDRIGLSRIAIVKIIGLDTAVATGTPRLTDFVLYLDGHAVATGADRGLTNTANNEIGFVLTRTSANRAAWMALLGSPSAWEKSVQVDVGVSGKSVLPTASGKPVTATLIVVDPRGLIVGCVLLLGLAAGLVIMGASSDLLRDNQPFDFGGAVGPNNNTLRRTFSLAQVQMAWWLALVLGAYIFLYWITGDFNTLTEQALILLGIGTGTALGAGMVEATKTDPVSKEFQDLVKQIADQKAAKATDAALQPLLDRRDALAPKLASTNFFTDILTDSGGISLHRAQMVGWTIVIGFVFIMEVYRNLALPAFDATILALLGISAGSYLGFKIPEHPY
jgi:hypothetical protein